MIRSVAGFPFLSMKSKHGCDSYSVRPHTHRELSVGIILEGSTTVSVEGLDIRLDAGDLIVIPPDQPHLCLPSDPFRFDFHMAFFDPEWLGGILRIDARRLSAQSFPAPGPWKSLLDGLAFGGSAAVRKKEIEEALKGLLSNRNADGSEDRGRSAMDAVHRMMREDPSRTFRVEDMAVEAGMSKYDFLRKYRSRYGLTPHSSLTDARIRKSLSLMREEGSLTNIAQDCGFSDQSHFTRQFKRYTGILPSEYRKAISSNRGQADPR